MLNLNSCGSIWDRREKFNICKSCDSAPWCQNAPKIHKGVMYSYAFVNIYCSVHELWMFIERWTLEGTISAALHLVLLLWTVSWRDLARPPQCLLGVRVDFERAPPSGESKALNHRTSAAANLPVMWSIAVYTGWYKLSDTRWHPSTVLLHAT